MVRIHTYQTITNFFKTSHCDKCSEIEECGSMSVYIVINLTMEVMEDFAKVMSIHRDIKH